MPKCVSYFSKLISLFILGILACATYCTFYGSVLMLYSCRTLQFHYFNSLDFNFLFVDGTTKRTLNLLFFFLLLYIYPLLFFCQKFNFIHCADMPLCSTFPLSCARWQQQQTEVNNDASLTSCTLRDAPRSAAGGAWDRG